MKPKDQDSNANEPTEEGAKPAAAGDSGAAMRGKEGKKKKKMKGKPAPPPMDWGNLPFYIAVAVVFLVAAGMFTYAKWNARELSIPADPVAAAPPDTPLKDFKVVNAHEHLMSRKFLDKYFKACDRTGIVKTLFVGSSDYTIKGKGGDPAKGNDENSDEILAASKENPGKIVPFISVHPSDPKMTDKVKDYVARGGRGVKLYTGHTNFYDRPLDAPEMMPLYAYCQESGVVLCWHVNYPKYAAEFERVLEKFPNLKIIVPHFGVTFFRPTEQPFEDFQKLLDKYPGLYTDTSFGTREILLDGLIVVGKHPDIFRAFFKKYSDRILFGTDMVITGNKEKTEDWIAAVNHACRSVLEKDRYTFFMAAKGSDYGKDPKNLTGELKGLALDDDILKKVYETNFEKLLPTTPEKPAP